MKSNLRWMPAVAAVLVLASTAPAQAARIYIDGANPGSNGFMDPPTVVLDQLIADGHTLVRGGDTLAPGGVPVVHTSVDPVNGFDWVLHYSNRVVTAADQTAIHNFLGQGGYVYLQGEVSCCNDAAVFAETIAKGETVGGAALAFTTLTTGLVAATWTGPVANCATAIPFNANATRIFTGVPATNQLWTSGLGTIAARWAGADLVGGHGVLAITGDINAFGAYAGPVQLDLMHYFFPAVGNAGGLAHEVATCTCTTNAQCPAGTTCTAGACITATCGDGTINQATEGCDDGNTANGDGCTSACLVETGVACGANPAGLTGNASCVAGVCDAADNKCGLANGNGACTQANQATVCRSGLCSANGTCLAPNTCAVDADCSANGGWCNQSTKLCTGKLPNGNSLPTDPAHTSPTLNATCTTDAATLTCVSAVCSASTNTCGYASGEGPCTAANAATVCQSGTCSSTSKLCVPAVNGCAVDADCSNKQWCNSKTFTCTPRTPNGTALPADNGHTPKLDGICTVAAATLTCQSGVCDPTDNKCGFADGNGTCTKANANDVCRSGFCGSNGVCEPPASCAKDTDCPGAWCNIAAKTCAPLGASGSSMPTDRGHGSNPTIDGTCNAAAAKLVCEQATCDSQDDACGFMTGTACAANSECRTGLCANGLCAVAGAGASLEGGSVVGCSTTNDSSNAGGFAALALGLAALVSRRRKA